MNQSATAAIDYSLHNVRHKLGQLYIKQADLYQQQGKPLAAEMAQKNGSSLLTEGADFSMYANLQKSYPKNDLLLRLRAKKLLSVQRVDEALEIYNNLLFTDQSNLYALTGKAYAEFMKRNYKNAHETFSQASALDPNNIYIVANIILTENKLHPEKKIEHIRPNILLPLRTAEQATPHLLFIDELTGIQKPVRLETNQHQPNLY